MMTSVALGVAALIAAFRHQSGSSLMKLAPAWQETRRAGGASNPSPAETVAGADAAGPSEIPAVGWKIVLKRAAAGFSDDRVMAQAAGVTFYALLALFPALAGLISIYGFFADPSHLSEQVQGLQAIIPGGGIDLIKAEIVALTTSGQKALGFGAVVGLLTSLWSANAGTKALFDALNVVYHETEKRSFVRLTLVSLCFTLGGIAFVIIALCGVVIVPVLLGFIGLGAQTDLLVRVVRWPLLLAVVAVLLSVVYRFGPSRRRPRWQWVTWGSAGASISWLAVSAGFSFYVQNFGTYNKTYGALGAVIGFMTWLWLSAMVVLMGAELNAELEQQTHRDTTIGADRPMGERGAYKADVKTPAAGAKAAAAVGDR